LNNGTITIWVVENLGIWDVGDVQIWIRSVVVSEPMVKLRSSEKNCIVILIWGEKKPISRGHKFQLRDHIEAWE
jgi:hypothetical protein